MKRTLFTLALLLSVLSLFAQDNFEHLNHNAAHSFLPPEADSGFWWSDRGGLFDPESEYAPQTSALQLPGMPVLHLPQNLTLHFLSPQPIQYVDISTKNIEGDLPLKNVLRLKIKENSFFNDAIVTIAGEDFIAQYHILAGGSSVPALIEIQPGDTRPIDISGSGLTQPELKKLANNLFTNCHTRTVETTIAFGLKAILNHVYTAGDYIFLDITYKNKTNLSYHIDDLRFKIDDKKVTKATNIQSLEIKPELTLFNTQAFDKYYRNIFVFKKMSFPGNKVLNIELREKQISGRVIVLPITYKDVLEADTIPN
jgi:conjugative transposon TraN protein